MVGRCGLFCFVLQARYFSGSDTDEIDDCRIDEIHHCQGNSGDTEIGCQYVTPKLF